MATPPDFSVGGVLTAAQMDQIGLWKVIPTSATGGTVSANGTVTLGSAVSSVTISGAFSAAFTNYRVIFSGTTPSATDSFRLQLGSATTGHYGSMYYDSWDGAANGILRVGNGSSVYISLDEASAKTSSTSFDVISPYLSQATQLFGNFSGRGFFGWFGALQNASTSFTSFTIKPDSSGTFTGGTVSIYGYNPL